MEMNNSDHSIKIPETTQETPFTNVYNEEDLPHEANRKANADLEVNREINADPKVNREVDVDPEQTERLAQSLKQTERL